MTREKENTVWRWAAGIAFSLIIALLTGQLVSSWSLQRSMMDMQKTNNEKHTVINNKANGLNNKIVKIETWEEIISDNKNRSVSNKERLDKSNIL